MNKRRSKVLLIARDAGAANALAPVARTLQADDYVDTVVVGFRYAEPVFRQHELPLWVCDDDCDTPGVAERLIGRERPDFVLTGTSMKAQRDGAFWATAQAHSIPTLAVLDHWSHYWERFSDENGPRFAYMPDAIAVMDASARHALIETGCPPERIIVTGQPYFDDFDNLTPAAEDELRTRARRATQRSKRARTAGLCL